MNSAEPNENIRRDRSPTSPRASLGQAIQYVEKLHAKAGRASIKPEAALGTMGYSSMNGAAMTMLATLAQYGLIDRERGGNMSVSTLALRILRPVGEDQHREAIKEAALRPGVFAEIFSGGYHDCAEEVLANHLLHNGFSEPAARKAAAIYKENASFAKLDTSSNFEPSIRVDSEPDRSIVALPITQPAAQLPTPKTSIVQIHPENVVKEYRLPLGDGAEVELKFLGKFGLKQLESLSSLLAAFKVLFAQEGQREGKISSDGPGQETLI